MSKSRPPYPLEFRVVAVRLFLLAAVAGAVTLRLREGQTHRDRQVVRRRGRVCDLAPCNGVKVRANGTPGECPGFAEPICMLMVELPKRVVTSVTRKPWRSRC